MAPSDNHVCSSRANCAERNAAAVFFVCRCRDEHSGQRRRAKLEKRFLARKAAAPVAGSWCRSPKPRRTGLQELVDRLPPQKTNSDSGPFRRGPAPARRKRFTRQAAPYAKVGPKARDGPLRCPIFVWGFPAHFSKTKPALFIKTVLSNAGSIW